MRLPVASLDGHHHEGHPHEAHPVPGPAGLPHRGGARRLRRRHRGRDDDRRRDGRGRGQAGHDVSAKADLVPIGATAIYALGLYTAKGYASPADIPAGGEVAIPNDPTNQARALLVLQSAHLVSLKDGGNALSTPADVLPGSKVKVVPVDANQTAVQLKSLDAAVINNNFAYDAKIDPTTAIYSDIKDPSAADPYINVWVAKKADADNPVYQKLIAIYHDKAVTDELLKENGGTALISDKSPAELQQILAGLEDLIRKSS